MWGPAGTAAHLGWDPGKMATRREVGFLVTEEFPDASVPCLREEDSRKNWAIALLVILGRRFLPLTWGVCSGCIFYAINADTQGAADFFFNTPVICRLFLTHSYRLENAAGLQPSFVVSYYRVDPSDISKTTADRHCSLAT